MSYAPPSAKRHPGFWGRKWEQLHEAPEVCSPDVPWDGPGQLDTGDPEVGVLDFRCRIKNDGTPGVWIGAQSQEDGLWYRVRLALWMGWR